MVFCTFSLRNVLRATTACTFWTSQLPKVVREWCFVHFHFEMCFAPQWRALFRHLNFQKWSENGVFCTFSLRNVLRATMACTFSTSEAPKVVRSWCVLYILTWKCASCHNGVAFSRSELPKVVREWGALHIFTSKCASRHNGVHFLDISTSKSGPRMVCFVHFDITSTCASRHNGVHFFDISTTKSGPHLVCFVHFDLEMCFAPQRRAIFHLSSGQLAPHPPVFASLLFEPPEPQIIGKTQCFATFLPFRASASSFFLLFFLLIFLFSLPLPCSAFHLSILSEV